MNEQNHAAALLPCPFCGSANIIILKGSSYRWGYYACNNCGANKGDCRKKAPTLPMEHPINAERFALDWNDRLAAAGAQPAAHLVVCPIRAIAEVCADVGCAVKARIQRSQPAAQEGQALDAARYRWLAENSFDRPGVTQFHVWQHTWEPHSKTGEPTEWKCRVRGTAIDRAIDDAASLTAIKKGIA